MTTAPSRRRHCSALFLCAATDTGAQEEEYTRLLTLKLASDLHGVARPGAKTRRSTGLHTDPRCAIRTIFAPTS